MDSAILLVDDEASCLSALSEYFGGRGFQVTEARELEEAEALISKFEYSLIIADLSLTALNSDEGLRLIDHVRDCSPKTKVVLLSGRISSHVRTEAFRRGAHAVLDKPHPLASLGILAEQLLEAQDGMPA